MFSCTIHWFSMAICFDNKNIVSMRSSGLLFLFVLLLLWLFQWRIRKYIDILTIMIWSRYDRRTLRISWIILRGLFCPYYVWLCRYFILRVRRFISFFVWKYVIIYTFKFLNARFFFLSKWFKWCLLSYRLLILRLWNIFRLKILIRDTSRIIRLFRLRNTII